MNDKFPFAYKIDLDGGLAELHRTRPLKKALSESLHQKLHKTDFSLEVSLKMIRQRVLGQYTKLSKRM